MPQCIFSRSPTLFQSRHPRLFLSVITQPDHPSVLGPAAVTSSTPTPHVAGGEAQANVLVIRTPGCGIEP